MFGKFDHDFMPFGKVIPEWGCLEKISYRFITEWLSFHKRVVNFKSSIF